MTAYIYNVTSNFYFEMLKMKKKPDDIIYIFWTNVHFRQLCNFNNICTYMYTYNYLTSNFDDKYRTIFSLK